MPQKIADALQVLGSCEARHVVKHIPRGSPDEDVFKCVSQLGGILVTQDEKIRRRPHQLSALKDAKIGAFILTGRAHKSVEEMMRFLLSVLPKIRELAAKEQVPYVYGVSDKGKIERLA